MNVVIDCNIFVMCMTPSSSYHEIFRKLITGAFKLNVTSDIIFEYIEVFQAKFNYAKADMVTDFLFESPHVETVEVYFKWNLIEKDFDDNKYVDCYIASNADFLVTNDRHFDILSENDFPPVRCINIDEFVKILAN